LKMYHVRFVMHMLAGLLERGRSGVDVRDKLPCRGGCGSRGVFRDRGLGVVSSGYRELILRGCMEAVSWVVGGGKTRILGYVGVAGCGDRALLDRDRMSINRRRVHGAVRMTMWESIG
jgi:hypothetical protein